MKRTAIIAVAALVLTIAVMLVQTRRDARLPETVWTEPLTGAILVLIPAQSFVMGTPPGEAGREAQEVAHTVTLTRPYYIARHEVTQAQWSAVMGSNPSHFNDCGACPVEGVSLHDVEAFLARLNAGAGDAAGMALRLPTEAEWELACRAGGSAPFGGWDALGAGDANIDGHYPYNAPRGDSRGRTTPVGSFKANAWGLFDMSGNVWEWVQDWHCPYPDGPITDPLAACATPFRVIRGGSWKFDANSARCGLRYTHRPQDLGYSLGFRLAASAR